MMVWFKVKGLMCQGLMSIVNSQLLAWTVLASITSRVSIIKIQLTGFRIATYRAPILNRVGPLVKTVSADKPSPNDFGVPRYLARYPALKNDIYRGFVIQAAPKIGINRESFNQVFVNSSVA